LQELERPGTFHAHPVEWEIKQFSSGSVSLYLKLVVEAQWCSPPTAEYPDGWIPWPADAYYVHCDVWVIGKDGSVIPTGVEQLRDAIGWDGDLDTVVGAPPAVSLTVDVVADDYRTKKDQVARFKGDWVRPYEYAGGGGGGSNAASAQQKADLKARVGAQLRAAAAKPGAPPQGAPIAAPPVAVAPQAPVAQPAQQAQPAPAAQPPGGTAPAAAPAPPAAPPAVPPAPPAAPSPNPGIGPDDTPF
jgi:hypothetical protein